MDKETLLAARVDTESGLPEMDVPTALGTVRVRGLSRVETLALREVSDAAQHERKTIAAALLDPTMTEAEVGQWQTVAVGGELTPVVSAILRLSALGGNSAKEVYKSFRGRAGSGVRVLPSGATEDDGGAAESGPESG